MASSKEQKRKQQLVEKLLRAKGIEYDEWLESQHDLIIQENQDLVLKALDILAAQENSHHTLTSNNKSSN